MKIFVPIFVGAIIGYFTNWLAIKMLFRPHYEKRIMGIKIPFTPGLIPKERARIAKSIGETVGVYLLSPETIIESLKDTNVEIKAWIISKIDKLKESRESIKEILMRVLGEKYNSLAIKVEENLTRTIINYTREENFINLLSDTIENRVNNTDMESIYSLLNRKLEDFILELSTSHKFKEALTGQIKAEINKLEEDERKISEIIPEDMISSINKFIDENGQDIGDIIKESFKDINVQKKLKESISELVAQNIPKMIMAFISPDAISEKIFHMIEKYIDSEDANRIIITIINSAIDRLLDAKTSEAALKLMENVEEENLKNISAGLIDYISEEEHYGVLIKLIEENLRNTEEENKKNIIGYLNNNIAAILNSAEFEESISKFISYMINQFLDMPIYSFTEQINGADFENIYSIGKKIFEDFAIAELPQIIQIFGISKIVEDKVNSFSVDFTEELILDIADKELKAITWLGALLGAIMGILTPLIQMLYR